MSRADTIAKNLKFAAICELLLAAARLVLRRVFVLTLGKEYLGINGLFTDVLTMLSLAELGFGASILYSLYRPVAQGDRETIKSLLQLYRRVCWAVGAFVLAAGLSLTPFLRFFVKEMPEDIPNLALIYILSVINSGVSYFFAYKAPLLSACQKRYIDTVIATTVSLAASALQILLLVLTRGYVLFLCVTIFATLARNMAITVQTDRMYPWVREKDVRPLPEELWRELRRNVSALTVQRLGEAVVYSTDNILISKLIGIPAAGTYSNYIMIRNFLKSAINTLFSAITPTIGNLSVTESDEKKRAAFRRLFFVSAWLFGWMSICLLWLYDPFIEIWLGPDYLLPGAVVFLIVANFYVTCMLIPVSRTRTAMGLFWIDRYKAIPEAALNLAASILLAAHWGIAGIVAGTLFSTLAVSFWVDPLVLCRQGLKLPVREYFARCFFYLTVTAAAGAVAGVLCQAVSDTVPGFLLRIVICTAVPNLIFWAAFYRTEEFRYFWKFASHLIQQTCEKPKHK